MTKITALVQKTYQGKPSGFTVTFDDGRTGNMEEKQSDKGLRVGDEVIVTEIPYVSKAGKTSTLYGVRLSGAVPATPQPTPHTSSGNPVPPLSPKIQVGVPKSKEELKADALIRSAGWMVEGFFAGKYEWPEVSEKTKYIAHILWSEIDDIFKA